MLVKFANIVAISFAAFGVQQAIATPVHDTESHDIARRTKSLKCGWVKSKHGKDLGCLCDSILGNVNADFDLGDVLSLVFGKSSKSYPPGCKPTCDGNGGYECPNGKDSKGNCLDDHGCEGGSCWDNGKCCPGGTFNVGGICCPKGCSNKDGKCHVDEPPQPSCTGQYEVYKDHKCQCKEGYSKEHDNAPCMPNCPYDQKRVGKDCVCKNPDFKPDHENVCRPQCKEPLKLNKHENVCKCPDEFPIYEHGKCKAAPPVCVHPKKLNDAKTACVCKEGYKENHEKMCILDCKDGKVPDHEGKMCVCQLPKVEEHGKCVTPPPTCTHPRVLNHEKTACVCKEGYTENHEKKCIIDCKDGNEPDSTGMKCVCHAPKVVKDGKCVDVPKCTHPEVLNTWTNKCECKEGYQKDWHTGKCVLKCKGDRVPDHEGKMCVCPEGKVPKEHSENQCVDKPPTCTHPEKFNGKKCVCEDGYKRNKHGVCEKECGWGKKWCKTKCCREDQEENDYGQCGCPHDWKDFKIGPITICKPPTWGHIL